MPLVNCDVNMYNEHCCYVGCYYYSDPCFRKDCLKSEHGMNEVKLVVYVAEQVVGGTPVHQVFFVQEQSAWEFASEENIGLSQGDPDWYYVNEIECL